MAVELGANATLGHVILISDESQRGPLGVVGRENKSLLNKGAAPQLAPSPWHENSRSVIT
jgi:hypothetical protein